jgi:hypothetical protein
VFEFALIELASTNIQGTYVFGIILICTMVAIICTATGLALSRKISSKQETKDITRTIN